MNKNELLAVLAQICNDAYSMIDLNDKKPISPHYLGKLKALAKQLHEIVAKLKE